MELPRPLSVSWLLTSFVQSAYGEASIFPFYNWFGPKTFQATPVYLSEVAPPKWRGAFNTGFQFFIGIGVVTANCINYGTAKHSWGWRLSLGLAVVPAVIMTLGALLISDTPSSLVGRGKLSQAKRALLKVRGSDSDVEAELTELIRCSEATRAASREPFMTIFERQYRPHLVIAIAIPLFQQVTGINIIAFYAPVLFQSVGFGSDSALIAAIILGLVNLGSILVSTFVVDRYGRRFLFMEGGTQMFLCQVWFMWNWSLIRREKIRVKRNRFSPSAINVRSVWLRSLQPQREFLAQSTSPRATRCWCLFWCASTLQVSGGRGVPWAGSSQVRYSRWRYARQGRASQWLWTLQWPSCCRRHSWQCCATSSTEHSCSMQVGSGQWPSSSHSSFQRRRGYLWIWCMECGSSTGFGTGSLRCNTRGKLNRIMCPLTLTTLNTQNERYNQFLVRKGICPLGWIKFAKPIWIAFLTWKMNIMFPLNPSNQFTPVIWFCPYVLYATKSAWYW